MIGFIVGILAALFGLVTGLAGGLIGVVMGLAGALFGLAVPFLPVLLVIAGIIWLLKPRNAGASARG
jgi:hypothetical protein